MLGTRALQRFGTCLSGQSLRKLFIRSHLLRKFFEYNWRAQNVWGTMLSFDHSLKVLKAQRIRHGQVLSNRATIMDNATGCILGAWSVATTSMDDAGLILAMEDFMKLAQDGRHELVCLWIDNPHRDLQGAQRRFKITKHTADPSNENNFSFDGKCQMATVIHHRLRGSFSYTRRKGIELDAKSDSVTVKELVVGAPNCLAWLVEGAKAPHYVGFDLEWRVTYSGMDTNESRRTALIQLALGGKCLLLRVHKTRVLPQALLEFLCSPDTTLLGRNILNDIKKMYKDFDLTVAKQPAPNFLDLGPVANRVLMTGKKIWKLSDLCSEILKKNLNKECIHKDFRGVQRADHSVWADEDIPTSHLRYAIYDAAVAPRIHMILEPHKYPAGDSRNHARASSHMCRNGHALLTTSVQGHAEVGCDLCAKVQRVGAIMHGCRVCDWDICDACACDRGSDTGGDSSNSSKGTHVKPVPSWCTLCGKGVVGSFFDFNHHVNACLDEREGSTGKDKHQNKERRQGLRALLRPQGEGLERYFVEGGICGPSWASQGYRNSCPMDTLLFVLNAWHSFLPNSKLREVCDEDSLSGQCVRLYQRGITTLLARIGSMTSDGSELSTALRSALDAQKHQFMKTLSTFKDPVFKQYLCRYQKKDCSSSVMVCLQPFLQELGSFRVRFSRVCSGCSKTFCFEQKLAVMNLPGRWRYFAHPKYQGRSPKMSVLAQEMLAEIAPEMDEEAKICSHCTLRNARYSSKSMTKREIVSCSRQFFIDVVASPSNCQVIQPRLEGCITLPVGKEQLPFYLNSLIFWPGYGHFTCVQYLHDDASPGWYAYDGMRDQHGPGLRCNGKFIGDTLEAASSPFEELVLLGYSNQPTLVYEWDVGMASVKKHTALKELPGTSSKLTWTYAGFDMARVHAAAEGKGFAKGGLAKADVRKLLRANEAKDAGASDVIRQTLKGLLSETDSEKRDAQEEKTFSDEIAKAIELSRQAAGVSESVEQTPSEGKHNSETQKEGSLAEADQGELLCHDEERVAAAVLHMGLLQSAESELAADGLMPEEAHFQEAKGKEKLSLEDVQRAVHQYAETPSVTAELRLPTTLTSDQRKSLHGLAQALELIHKSEGESSKRVLVISKKVEQGITQKEECAFDPYWYLLKVKYDIKHFLGNIYTMARTGSKYYAIFCSTIADAVLVALPGERARVEAHFLALGMTPDQIACLPRRIKRGFMKHAVLEPSKLYQRLKSTILLFSLLREPETGNR